MYIYIFLVLYWHNIMMYRCICILIRILHDKKIAATTINFKMQSFIQVTRKVCKLHFILEYVSLSITYQCYIDIYIYNGIVEKVILPSNFRLYLPTFKQYFCIYSHPETLNEKERTTSLQQNSTPILPPLKKKILRFPLYSFKN